MYNKKEICLKVVCNVINFIFQMEETPHGETH